MPFLTRFIHSLTSWKGLLVGFFWVYGLSPCLEAGTLECRSPGGNLQLKIHHSERGLSDNIAWSMVFKDQLRVDRSELSLVFEGIGDLLANVEMVQHERRFHDQTIPVLFGKSSHARDRFEEQLLVLQGPQGVRLRIRFRCYEDALAFRYELLEGPSTNPWVLRDERSTFVLHGQPMVWVQYLEHHRTSHEHEVENPSWNDVRPETLLDCPLTVQWPDGVTAAITEASLRAYPGMALSQEILEGSRRHLRSRLTPREDGTKAVGSLPWIMPWRVVLIGERPGALLESNTLYCLNEPSAMEDASWIEPDKLTFHWWNGDVFHGTPDHSPLSVEMAKRYIDFCADQGLGIHAISSTASPTSPWYHQLKPGVAPGPQTDVTRPREDFDLSTIRAYAESKQVRLWTWVHQDALRGRVEEAFAAFEAMGWKGMMVDFFDHDDQDHVVFAEQILQAAARHHILIHFHGIWKPTGLRRTYPNLMNHEGALNLEYLKWSDRCTPTHNLKMAFTRLLAGPMDYHLGGFRAVPAESFQPRQVAPEVLGTRCHMLAMYVCFENPAPMVADYPTAYLNQPGFDFIVEVPTWWDETRVLKDSIAELLVMARRKGDVWYLGGMSGERSHAVSLSLGDLLKGQGRMHLWEDVDARFPNQLRKRSVDVGVDDVLKVHLEAGGGFVARLEERKRP